ncbi:hypothetical protein F3Y22_tig00002840pilonHSYRG01494 [Hibiscus syriacus]|uniref:Uncharacterized protein n=1 Tax=Hibiscus syriacus TaxID=106335 RepID=A0A6A3CVX8_HIBSY|nr:hypothetical protein F3Y22_tig00002840pilonHSYRG01494 [Hibiscus syriacus]
MKLIMPSIISPNQTSFISDRNITENIILNQEVIHSMRHSKGHKGWMAIKVDLKKAFDRLRPSQLSFTLSEANFGHYSGHRVNKRKTTVYFSPNTSASLKETIRDCLGFQRVAELGKYLSILVRHGRSRRSDYEFILEKMRGLLEGWATSSLSTAGRVTLAKSVFASIPIYFMQTSMLLMAICHEIEKLIRYFIWGSTYAHSTCSLINWEVICQPILPSLRSGGDYSPHYPDSRTGWECPWHFLFVSLVWLLCKRMNELIFNQGCKSVEDTFFAALAWARHFACSEIPRFRPSQDTPQVIQWDKPPLGWVAINTDGAVTRDNQHSTAGGIFRDSSGRWILGYIKTTGCCSPLQTALKLCSLFLNLMQGITLSNDALESIFAILHRDFHTPPY